jgi:hypothetical protein
MEARIMAAREAGRATYKRPHQIYVVDDFPRSTLNKVSKAALRASLKAWKSPRNAVSKTRRYHRPDESEAAAATKVWIAPEADIRSRAKNQASRRKPADIAD